MADSSRQPQRSNASLRLMVRTLLGLLLAIGLTIAVTWVGAARTTTNPTVALYSLEGNSGMLLVIDRGGSTLVWRETTSTMESIGARAPNNWISLAALRLPLHPELVSDQTSRTVFGQTLAGWPWPCLSSYYAVDWSVSQFVVRDAITLDSTPINIEFPRGQVLSTWRGYASMPSRVLPLDIHWLNFARDVLAFFLGIAATFIAVRYICVFARGRFRRQYGLCMGCGYNRIGLASDQPCPECGKQKLAV